jgi:hypothetical protein
VNKKIKEIDDLDKLNRHKHFKTTVEIPRIMRGEKQELETLFNEEALLFAKFLRNEIKEWKPRTPIISK